MRDKTLDKTPTALKKPLDICITKEAHNLKDTESDTLLGTKLSP